LTQDTCKYLLRHDLTILIAGNSNGSDPSAPLGKELSDYMNDIKAGSNVCDELGNELDELVLGLPLISPSIALLSPLVLKYQIDLSTILLLFFGTISHLIYVRLFITSPLLLF